MKEDELNPYRSIGDYFQYLIDKCGLKPMYMQYLIVQVIYIFVRESFFWFLIIATQKKSTDYKYNRRFVIILFSILLLTVILEYFFNKIRIKFLYQLEKCHLDTSIDLLHTMNRDDLLQLSIHEYIQRLRNVTDGLRLYLQRQSLIISFVAIVITIILSLRRLNILLILGLLIVVNIVLYYLQKSMIERETDLVDRNMELNLDIDNYVLDSRQKILNNHFNRDYLNRLYYEYEDNAKLIQGNQLRTQMYNAISVILITVIALLANIRKVTMADVFIYLLIVYDLDAFLDTVAEYYRMSRSLIKTTNHLEFLGQFYNPYPKYVQKRDREDIESLTIRELYHNAPELRLMTPIHLHVGEHVLVQGRSGTGKTTLFKLLKHIVDCPKSRIEWNGKNVPIEDLDSNIYYTLQSAKPMYANRVYSYVSNYDDNPDVELIKQCLKCVCLDHKFWEDEEIVLSNLSGGEMGRMSLGSSMYSIIKSNRKIILFDEVDANLDTETATRVYSNLMNMLKNHIVLHICHSEPVKRLFKKQITIDNNKIYFENGM